MKAYLVLLVLVIITGIAIAFPKRVSRRRQPTPQKVVAMPKLATPCPTVIETCAPKVKGLCCNEPLILPPKAVELPTGLGYFQSAIPLIADAFEPAIEFLGGCTGAYIPVSPPDSCLILAAPLCPELAPLIKPIVL